MMIHIMKGMIHTTWHTTQLSSRSVFQWKSIGRKGGQKRRIRLSRRCGVEGRSVHDLELEVKQEENGDVKVVHGGEATERIEKQNVVVTL